MVQKVPQPNKIPTPEKCPTCGRCPTCGHVPGYVYPVYPRPLPYWQVTYGTNTWSSTNV